MRVCLVSNEILGAGTNGGIGTATSNLGLLLAHAGHQVTLFYVGRPPLSPEGPWPELYRRAGVQVAHFPEGLPQISPWWMRKPAQIFEQLSREDFDVIVFQEWMALGHACMVAKRCGLAFGRTVLAVVAHSSTAWINEANHSFTSSPEQLGLMHMERQAVEMADALVAPSNYLMDWMRGAGWALPADACVVPNFLGARRLFRADESPKPPSPVRRPEHIVFFGRLEERKGIGAFLSALAQPPLQGRDFRLTFLGRPATHSREEVEAILRRHRLDLLPRLEILTDLSSDAAQAFLRAHPCVAVMPSLLDNSPCVVWECLQAAQPFVASSTGGTPELIAEADRRRVLVEPKPRPLAEKLAEVLDSEQWEPAAPAHHPAEVGRDWLNWFERLGARRAAPVRAPAVAPRREAEPAISVVITHHERPQHLERVLRSFDVQTFTDFEVILVDDGSRSEAAMEALRRAGQGVGALRPRVVHQENAYVGAARNTGLRHARAERIVFMDDDNLAFPTMLETFHRASRVSGADIVTSQILRFVQDDGPPDPSLLVSGERMAFPGGPAALALFNNPFGDATAIYKREVFERIGGFHERHGVTYEDWQFHLRAVLAGLTLLSIPVPLFWYRVGANSVLRSTQFYDNTKAVTEVFEQHMDPQLRPLIDLFITLKRERTRATSLDEIASAPRDAT